MKEIRADDKMVNEENKNVVKSIIDSTPGLLADDKRDFQDINFSPNTTDNMCKLLPKIQKHLDEMVIDAVEPKIEPDFYIDDDLDSYMFAAEDSENNNDDSIVMDIKPKNEQVKRKVGDSDDDDDDDDDDYETKIIHISPPESYVDIEKSLNATVVEISSDSEDEVTYTKTTPYHPRDKSR